MKKLIVLIGTMMINVACLAASNIYCPASITCTKEGDIGSCKMSEDNGDWADMINVGKVKAVTYKFHSAHADYEGNISNFRPSCQYQHEPGSGTNDHIRIRARKNNLQASIDNVTKWEIGDVFFSLCWNEGELLDNDNLSCPFQYILY